MPCCTCASGYSRFRSPWATLRTRALQKSEEKVMKGNRFWRILKIVVIVTVAVNVFGYAIMSLWNWLMPAMFGLKTINFLQALGLLVLFKILFGGFHRHGRSEERRPGKDGRS